MEAVIARGGDKRTRERTYHCMNGVPGVVNQGNFIGEKIHKSENRKEYQKPCLRDKRKIGVDLVEVEPASGNRESEKRKVRIYA